MARLQQNSPWLWKPQSPWAALPWEIWDFKEVQLQPRALQGQGSDWQISFSFEVNVDVSWLKVDGTSTNFKFTTQPKEERLKQGTELQLIISVLCQWHLSQEPPRSAAFSEQIQPLVPILYEEENPENQQNGAVLAAVTDACTRPWKAWKLVRFGHTWQWCRYRGRQWLKTERKYQLKNRWDLQHHTWSWNEQKHCLLLEPFESRNLSVQGNISFTGLI